jgi:glycosyltransferase involved in cell wall biosynthesis
MAATRFWSINGRFLTQPLSGVQRYAQEIVRAMDELLDEDHPLTRDLSLEILAPPGSVRPLNLRAATLRQAGRGAGQLWEQFSLPNEPRGGLISLCNLGPLRARKHIVCIHDANTRIHPSSYSAKFRALYRVLLPALGRRAKHITTVSEFSAAQLARFGIAPREKTTVISGGHEHALAWTPRHSTKSREVAGEGTILAIGSPAPHKNVQMLVALADALAASGLRLAIGGSLDPKVFNQLRPQPVASNVDWIGAFDDEELAALLADSLCLAIPSFAEGFGLPAVEAMARGCPIVSTDRASLPEVCGDAALYASPTDPAAWLFQFNRLKDDPNLRNELSAKGRVRAHRFSWRRSAERYLQLMALADGLTNTASSAKAHDQDLSPLPAAVADTSAAAREVYQTTQGGSARAKSDAMVPDEIDIHDPAPFGPLLGADG